MKDAWVLIRYTLAALIAVFGAVELITGDFDRGLLCLILSYVMGIETDLDARHFR